MHSKDHLKNKKLYLENTLIPTSWTDGADSLTYQVRDVCNTPYGAAHNIHDGAVCTAMWKPQSLPIVSMVDRVSYLEGLVASFVAENSLFSFTPKLIEFVKEYSRDSKALNGLQMSRETVAYKLKEGVSAYYKRQLVQKMKSVPFSINIDECVSSNYRKVLSILVSYFDDDIGKTVIHHYESVDMIVVKATTLKDKLVELFNRDAIPLSNVVSDLSDSTNYMRGKKGGIETLLRQIAP